MAISLRFSTNLCCPRKECAKTDGLISHSFNAAACGAHMSNTRAILLAALQKIMSTENLDLKALINSALLATGRDVREVGSSAVPCRRQVRLAQTSCQVPLALPDPHVAPPLERQLVK